MLTPALAPEYLLKQVQNCPNCEADRRPRMFICSYHEGWWDGYESRRIQTETEH